MQLFTPLLTFPASASKLGRPPQRRCPFLAQQRSMWLTAPAASCLMLHGHAAPCVTCWGMLCPSSVRSAGRLPGQHGGPPLTGWGHRLSRPQALLRPVRGSCRTRLSRHHPLPSLQNVTLPAWAARGRAPPSVESALPATARKAASVKVSGCTCSTGAFPGATCRCGWGPGEARSSCPHTSACPLPKRPPGAPAEPLPPLSNARPVSASVHA